MLVFVIPVKSPLVSKSLNRFSKLFERCIQSVCNQTSPDFRVIVVCNEKPNTQFNRPHIQYIEVDFPPPNLDSASYGQARGSGDADKAKKILTGLAYAEKFQPSHIMVVDADDCVSKYLAEFVNQNSQDDGWYLQKGYVYEEGRNFIYLNLKNFNQSCGSSVIIKYNLFNLLFYDLNYYDHNNHELQNGILLKPLPFPGAIYSIKNEENQFMKREQTKQLKKKEGSLLFFIRKAMKYRPIIITKSIRNNFGLYSID